MQHVATVLKVHRTCDVGAHNKFLRRADLAHCHMELLQALGSCISVSLVAVVRITTTRCSATLPTPLPTALLHALCGVRLFHKHQHYRHHRAHNTR